MSAGARAVRILEDIRRQGPKVWLPWLAHRRYGWFKTANYSAERLTRTRPTTDIFGQAIPAGEPDRYIPELNCSQPSRDVNGVWGAYGEETLKTVIPAEAHAKSFFCSYSSNPAVTCDTTSEFVKLVLVDLTAGS
ncbi:MAG: hypothetical protein QNI99_18280 [Woeseiaceae bacterium]|nr:hypothetical protein [Woeseiaceae bacterium]